MRALPLIVLALGFFIQSPKASLQKPIPTPTTTPIASQNPIVAPAPTPEQVYKVDVITPQSRPLDTKLFPLYLWITGAGVIINGLVWFAIFQQTKLNRIAALASKASADAIRNSERAWLLPRAADMSPDVIRMFYINFGKTPANIVLRTLTNCVVDDITQLPTIPLYEAKDNRHGLPMIGQGEEQDIETWYNPFLEKHSAIRDAINAQIKILVVYGVVKYCDIFDSLDIHESRFCYVWNVKRNRFFRGGPDAYNKHT